MIAKISNHRGIEYAEIELHDLTILAGPNGSGKTSICQAIAGLVSGDPNVYALAKKDMRNVIRTGQKSGTISIEDEDSGLTIDIPNGKIQSFGKTPPIASQFAVGIQAFTGISPKERIDLLRRLYNAEPSKEQLFNSIRKTGAGDDKIEKLWQTIQALGWDQALKNTQNKGREFKGQWEYVTKENYGSQKADGWKPDGWEAVLDNATEQQLVENISEAKAWYQSGIKAEAQASVEVDKLEALAGASEELKRHVMRANDEYEAKKRIWLDLSAKDKGYVSEPQECPHCKKPLIINGGTICKATVTKAKAQRAFEEWQKLRGEIEGANTQKENAYVALAEAKGKMKEAEEAKEKLDEISKMPETERVNIEEAENKVRHAETLLALWKMKREADRLHETIKLNAIIQEALSPDGLRAEALKDALDVLNGILKYFCAQAKWKILDITVDNAMTVRANNIEYRFLSESEQLFVDYVFQLCIAAREEADLVILDRLSNINDRDGRNGILRCIKATQIPAIVVFAMNERAEIPAKNLKNGYRAYWIENGAARMLAGEGE